MASTPQEAGKVTKDEREAVDAAEKKLDKLLRSKFTGEGPVRIVDPVSTLNKRSREELLRRYRSAGWTVTKKHEPGCSDPREYSAGYDYWTFNGQSRGFEQRDRSIQYQYDMSRHQTQDER